MTDIRATVLGLTRRIAMMLTRAVVTGVNDQTKMQALQISMLADETKDNVEHPQPYGLTSHPIPGAEAFAGCIGGQRDHAVVLVVDDRRYRPRNLNPGEVALYDHLGKFIHMMEDGTLHIKAPRVVIEATDELTLYAGVRYRWDVHGYAQEIRHEAGTTWQIETWQQGAVFAPPVVNNVSPPRTS
ncbi:MAG: phage baseplate assembly protein [Rhodospirillales bacterium]|nr:phage baseplate assembly protein [Rhodospirillales bacterium]